MSPSRPHDSGRGEERGGAAPSRQASGRVPTRQHSTRSGHAPQDSRDADYHNIRGADPTVYYPGDDSADSMSTPHIEVRPLASDLGRSRTPRRSRTDTIHSTPRGRGRGEEEGEGIPGGLAEIQRRLEEVTRDAELEEDRREAEFRASEEARHQQFLEAEQRREAEANAVREALLQNAGSKTPRPEDAPLPIPDPGAAETMSGTDFGSDTSSVRASIRPVSIRHGVDVGQLAQAIHELTGPEMESERMARTAAEQDREDARAAADALKDARIRDLEAQVAELRNELENEKAQRQSDEAEVRERQQSEMRDLDESLRNQLGDITNIVTDQSEILHQTKAAAEDRWEEKQARRNEKQTMWEEMREMMKGLREELGEEREEAREARANLATKDDIGNIVEELKRQNAELQELLRTLSDGAAHLSLILRVIMLMSNFTEWREDSKRQLDDMLQTVKSTAQEQVPFNVQGVCRPCL